MASSGYLLYYALHCEEKKFDGTLLSKLPVNYNDRYNEKYFHEEKKRGTISNDIKIKVTTITCKKKNAIIVFGLYIELSVYRYEFPSNTGC